MIYNDFELLIKALDLSTLDANPLTFNIDDFDSETDFVKSMFLSGKFFSSESDIVVRYSKPYMEDGISVSYRFQIFKSKTKMLLNYLKDKNEKIVCFLGSNKEIKDSMKFFNSIGVKGWDMIPLSSKDSDYATMLKDGLNAQEDVNSILITIEVGHDNDADIDYPMLSYEYVNAQKPSNFDSIKEWMKLTIFGIHE